jgi:hypothetical protein
MDQKLLPRGICIATLLFFAVACSSGPAPIDQNHVVEIYPVKDLLSNRSDARWDLAVKDVATAIAEATGMAQLGASGGSIESEASGIIMVTASPDMQDRVIMVLNDWRQLLGNKG